MPHTAAILRRWRAGYRLPQIAKELKCRDTDVAGVLLRSGVTWLQIEARANKDRGGKRTRIL